MIFGAHVRRRGHGVEDVVRECRARGADCAQIFISNPRAWAPPAFSDAEAEAFRAEWRASGLGPLAVHASYPINVAAGDPAILRRTRTLLRATVRTAEALGADVVVVHSGSAGSSSAVVARRRAARVLREAAVATPRVRLVAELMAGTAGAVASTVEEAASLLEAVDDTRVGLCLDSCHLFAAGYGIDSPGGVDGLLDELTGAGLLGRVALVHANDSVFGCGEHRDRHADIGEGTIGTAGWRALVGSALATVPWILETPGDERRQRRDIARLRRLAAGGPPARGRG